MLIFIDKFDVDAIKAANPGTFSSSDAIFFKESLDEIFENFNNMDHLAINISFGEDQNGIVYTNLKIAVNSSFTIRNSDGKDSRYLSNGTIAINIDNLIEATNSFVEW